MKRFISAFALVFCLLSFPLPANTQDISDIIIGDIDIPVLRWGRQKATFTAENKSDYVRFLAVVTELKFEGTYMNPTRAVRRHFILEPWMTEDVITDVNIPGNYGTGHVTFAIYDMIDTLDALLETQKIVEQPLTIQFAIPDAAIGYFKNRMSLPPMVANSHIFDNEFTHVLLLMISEGKTILEITEITTADSSFVEQMLDTLANNGFMTTRRSDRKVVFPIISASFADDGKKIATRLSDSLATVITKNFGGHQHLLDSLIAAGALSPDKNDFSGGGSIMYKPYPLVTAFVLWASLGQKFVDEAKTLAIFNQTDPCNANIQSYMYAVQGGDVVNGNQYFNLTSIGRQYTIDFGDPIPQVICPRTVSVMNSLNDAAHWRYEQGSIGESYLFDGAVVAEALKLLEFGTGNHIAAAKKEIDSLAAKYGHIAPYTGIRYWFWNLVATQTTNKLVKAKLIEKNANGQYKLVLKTK
ncbi:MAG: hypothetical protein SGI97_08215 [candidate division Zixibacteria bacterium]|nr:hypothetical protein [candidate division Zixibacteria bacterium]